jgi:hypothetical protein
MPSPLFFSACVAAAAVLYYLWTSKQPLQVHDLVATKHVIISTDLSAGVTGPHGGCAHCNPQLRFPDGEPRSTTQQGNLFINYRPQARSSGNYDLHYQALITYECCHGRGMLVLLLAVLLAACC